MYRPAAGRFIGPFILRVSGLVLFIDGRQIKFCPKRKFMAKKITAGRRIGRSVLRNWLLFLHFLHAWFAATPDINPIWALNFLRTLADFSTWGFVTLPWCEIQRGSKSRMDFMMSADLGKNFPLSLIFIFFFAKTFLLYYVLATLYLLILLLQIDQSFLTNLKFVICISLVV